MFWFIECCGSTVALVVAVGGIARFRHVFIVSNGCLSNILDIRMPYQKTVNLVELVMRVKIETKKRTKPKKSQTYQPTGNLWGCSCDKKPKKISSTHKWRIFNGVSVHFRCCCYFRLVGVCVCVFFSLFGHIWQMFCIWCLEKQQKPNICLYGLHTHCC